MKKEDRSIVDTLNPSKEEIKVSISQSCEFEVIVDSPVECIGPLNVLWRLNIDQFLQNVQWDESAKELLTIAVRDALNPTRWSYLATLTGCVFHITEFSGDYNDAGCFQPINYPLITLGPNGRMESTSWWEKAKLRPIINASTWFIAHRNFSAANSIYIKTPEMDMGIQGSQIFAAMNLDSGVNAMFFRNVFEDFGNIKWSELAKLVNKEIRPYNTHGQCWGHISAIYKPDGSIEDVPHTDHGEDLPYLP
jgi:hypothetical protein